jgi:UDP-N-acetyl-D-mannosaminuronate dehydrogenase
VGLNGLAFKSGTDDLRESPIVLIAEHLIGKGFDVKIYDPAIETSMITGTNREYIERHIPHLSSRIVHTLDELIEHSEVLLITRDGEKLLDRLAAVEKRPGIVDLRGQGQALKRLLDGKRKVKVPQDKAELAGSNSTRPMVPHQTAGRNGGNGKAKKVCND